MMNKSHFAETSAHGAPPERGRPGADANSAPIEAEIMLRSTILLILLTTATLGVATPGPQAALADLHLRIGDLGEPVFLQPADPRSPAAAALDPEASRGLYVAQLSNGAVLNLVWRDGTGLGVISHEGRIQWVQVDGASLVSAPSAPADGQIVDVEFEASSDLVLPAERDGRLQLMIDGDVAFRESFGAAAEAHQLAILHLVAGIFAAQFQIVIEVVQQHVWDAPIPGTRPGSCGNVFTPWRLHWESVAPTTSDPREASHLFTGLDLGAALGCAYTGQLESSAAYGLHKSRPAADDWLLTMREVLVTAHELGHNFGGRHDRAAPTPGGPVMISGPCTLTTVATIMHPCSSLALLPVFSDAHGQAIFAERQIMKDGGNAPHMAAFAASRI